MVKGNSRELIQYQGHGASIAAQVRRQVPGREQGHGKAWQLLELGAVVDGGDLPLYRDLSGKDVLSPSPMNRKQYDRGWRCAPPGTSRSGAPESIALKWMRKGPEHASSEALWHGPATEPDRSGGETDRVGTRVRSQAPDQIRADSGIVRSGVHGDYRPICRGQDNSHDPRRWRDPSALMWPFRPRVTTGPRGWLVSGAAAVESPRGEISQHQPTHRSCRGSEVLCHELCHGI